MHYNRAAAESGEYSEGELRFMRWLGSEAWVPIIINGSTRAVIVLGKHQSGHFTEEKIQSLRQYEDFVRAFYHLAELTEDRFRKAYLLRNIAGVLPDLVNTRSIQSFWHAVCVLLTCEHGFGFDRAMLFWLDNRQLPAECKFAVGGLGDKSNNPDRGWPSVQSGVRQEFRSLGEYMRHAFQHAESPNDPLYREVQREKVLFSDKDSGKILEMVEGRLFEGEVIKLQNDDPWIAKIRKRRPGIFCSPSNEYFLFPLKPLAQPGNRQAPLIGFVLADLVYRSEAHSPGPAFPELQMAALVLHWISAMWLSRENMESYFYVLEALPVLQHKAPHLGQAVSDLGTSQESTFQELKSALEKVTTITKEFEQAAAFVDGMRIEEHRSTIDNLGKAIESHCGDAHQRYDSVRCHCQEATYSGPVRIPSYTLDSVLNCLVHNAVVAANNAGQPVVNIGFRTDVIKLPLSDVEESDRVLITVENDGPPIDEDVAPYLFVGRLSTRGGMHRGTGLSSARHQVKSYGGDLILVDCGHGPRKKVTFQVVLEPFQPGHTPDEHP